jgi:hypothetical protein
MKTQALVAVICISVLCGVLMLMSTRVSAEKDRVSEVKTLHDDIMICNLLTGLYLSDEQLQKLIPLARRAGELKERFDRTKEEYMKKGCDVLQAVRSDVIRTGDASESTKRRYHEIKGPFEKEEDAFKAEMKSLNGQVQSILTENQKCIVASYKPCIIPIRSISNPERIGQAGGNEGVIKALTRAREVPQEKYEQAKKRFLEKVTPRLEKELDEKDIPAFLDKISAVMDKVRKMTPEEFEIQKSSLAEQLQPRRDVDEGDALRNKINRFILNARFIDVASARKKLANGSSQP